MTTEAIVTTTTTGLEFAAGITPVIGQAQSTDGAGRDMTVGSQAAEAESEEKGGDYNIVLGFSDEAAPYQTLNIFAETVAGGERSQIARLSRQPGGVMALVMGGGTNGVGAGVAGVQFAAYPLINIASHSDTNVQSTNDAGARTLTMRTSGAEDRFYLRRDGAEKSPDVGYKLSGCTTENATPEVLGAYTPAAGSAVVLTVDVLGQCAATGEIIVHSRRVVAKRASGGTTSVLSCEAVGTDVEQGSLSGCAVAIAADTPDVEVTVTGLASTTIKWGVAFHDVILTP